MALDAFATLNQFRAFLRVPIPTSEPVPPTEDDVTMALALASASDAIRNKTNRTFELKLTTAAKRVFTPYRSKDYSAIEWMFDPFQSVWRVHQPMIFVDDVQDLTGVTVTNRVSGQDLTAKLARGWPYNALSKGKSFVALEFQVGTPMPFEEGSIEITAKWGWTAVPDTIVNATLVQASRFYKRRDAPFGVAGSDAMGNSMRLFAKVDPDVAVMVSSYNRIWGAA